jgi:hypothetical protein
MKMANAGRITRIQAEQMLDAHKAASTEVLTVTKYKYGN